MNFKRLIICFSIFVVLFISMSVISASEENNVISAEQNSNIDYTRLSQDVNVVDQSKDRSSVLTSDVSAANKIKTKVEADQVVVVYKKNNYFRVKVEDRYDDDIPIEHVKLKITVGSGSNSKTFNVKTNSYGVAKINTKSLKVGTHKVVVTSADENYDISKKSKIYVGKQLTKTLKSTAKLKNKDVIKLKVKNDFDEKEVKVVLKKAKFTKILKAKFYFKDKKTGKTLTKTDKADFDDGRWDLPEADFPTRYSLLKVKVYYISTK